MSDEQKLNYLKLNNRITMNTVVKNQFSKPIGGMCTKIRELKWRKPIYLIPSIITFCVFGIVLLFFVIMWPYGLLPMVATIILDFMKETNKEMKGKTANESAPYIIAIGLCFIIYVPFFFLCLPIYVIGYIGKYFSGLD